MTTPPSFPSLRGLGWSKKKTPNWNTIVQKHPSGSDVRMPLWQYPLWDFELVINGLDGSLTDRGLGANSLMTMFGFFMGLGGNWAQFLYTDPDDSSVTGQTIGTADGTTTDWTLVRTMGGFTEPVGWVTDLIQVYLNGSPTSGYSLIAPNVLSFMTAPTATQVITADFDFSFLCHMMNDNLPFEQFMFDLWSVKTLKFRSTRGIPDF